MHVTNCLNKDADDWIKTGHGPESWFYSILRTSQSCSYVHDSALLALRLVCSRPGIDTVCVCVCSCDSFTCMSASREPSTSGLLWVSSPLPSPPPLQCCLSAPRGTGRKGAKEAFVQCKAYHSDPHLLSQSVSEVTGTNPMISLAALTLASPKTQTHRRSAIISLPSFHWWSLFDWELIPSQSWLLFFFRIKTYSRLLGACSCQIVLCAVGERRETGIWVMHGCW